MGGGLDGTFEVEVVDYFWFGVEEVQEASGMVELWTVLEQILGPFHEDPANSTGFELFLPIFLNQGYLYTGSGISTK